MTHPKRIFFRSLILLSYIICQPNLSGSGTTLPPPANDNCADAIPIPIGSGGFDYGVFISETSDLSMATAQAGEFFAESGHTRSVWYEFSVPTHRSLSVNMGGTNLGNVAVTVYEPTNCLPQSSFLTGTLLANGGGDITNSCSRVGLYRVQVTGPANSIASVFIILTLACPSSPTALYDCPADAFVFNGGNPIPTNQVSSGTHDIECQSLEQQSEVTCLPIANRNDFLKSTWYVFTTGSTVDLLIFYFGIGSNTERAGYRLFEGNVRNTSPDMLPQIACGMAIHDNHTRHIEFPCDLQPNTTYSLSLMFHENFNSVISLSAQQRSVSPTGWPRPTLPPVIASNQLGALPESIPGTTTVWMDRFDCSSFIIDNICPPANPNSGTVTVGAGINTRTFDLATWATFTIIEDADVTFDLNSSVLLGEFHTRIFNTTLDNDCPSPDTGSDLVFQFSGRSSEFRCMPPGDYSIQVLSSSGDPNIPMSMGYDEDWTYGVLGTPFSMELTVFALPSIGLFRLDAPGNFDPINNMNALLEDVQYPSVPAVMICENTVIPDNTTCPDLEKAIYRQAYIGDADGDGMDDEGLLTISRLRTDTIDAVRLVYTLLQGDANQLATAAGTHAEGQLIPGMTDYLGFCIDEDDETLPPDGIDEFCVCVTPGTYTLAALGNEDHVGFGDEPGFKFNTYQTIHDSRDNAELIDILNIPGTFASGPDIFSCADNRGAMPPCGRRNKLVYREFFLPDSAVVTISEIGNTTSVLSLFSGQASDPAADLTLIEGCFNTLLDYFDPCTPLPEGWYTIVSYGEGPNYTDNRAWHTNVNLINEYMGDPRDVGKTTRVIVMVEDPVIPNYNLPEKAYQGGITDWTTLPVNNPNAVTSRIYQFPRDTFCKPDTPFIPEMLMPCTPDYNRVSMYVFEITKPSFVQIRNLDPSFYTEVYPFDVNAEPGSLLTVPPVYQCFSANTFYRQICDLPPGIYTIVIHANDMHEGLSIGPAIYVDASEQSRFDHAWNAYDFDLIPPTSTYVNGKLNDVHPIPSQAPSRDVFYCTTGARSDDPEDTRCNTLLNDLIYAQPPGFPKPQFIQNVPPPPLAQPWRNLWYTFELSGSGVCTIQTQVLSGVNRRPLIAVYESDADASISWTDLQTQLITPQNSIINGLRLIRENVNILCDAEVADFVFDKNGCLRDSVRYYIVVSFDADNGPNPPNLPNQAISVSIRYDPKPTFDAAYDERIDANVVNGLIETAPPYTNQPLTIGSTYVSTDFSLLCYTSNFTDPVSALPCFQTNRSAWFKFDVDASGQLFTALEKRDGPPGWHTDASDISIWRENTPGGALTQELTLTAQFIAADQHSWLRTCIEPGTYFLLVRDCGFLIDTIQSYRVVMKLIDPPGDFCSNAIPLNVPDFNPASATVIPDCHTIGTDYGEFSAIAMGCLYEPGQQKTSWFHVTVSAAAKMDITFQLAEAFDLIDMDRISYRIFAGSCGALTPIACSSIGNNIITQRCLAPGDYYVQIAMPESIGNESVLGSITLTITSAPNTDPDCLPEDVAVPLADFTYTTDCESVTFNNFSTAGTDITYLWEFPDGTSTDPNPIWTPSLGVGTYPVTLTVTNTLLNTTSSITLNVAVGSTIINYIPLADAFICNDEGPLTIDATVPGPDLITYRWDNNSTDPIRTISIPGSYWIAITKDGCELLDTFIVTAVNAQRNVVNTLCEDESLTIAGQLFDLNNPSGIVIIPNAHASGCDSIVTVSLSFHAPSGSQFSETICDGETYTFAGQQWSTSGNYTDTLTSASGCDSLVVLTLTVTPQEVHQHVIMACLGETLTLQPAVTGTSYAWDAGPLSETLSVENPGTYEVSVSDGDGCLISVETFLVTFGMLASPVALAPEPVCPGDDVILVASGSQYDYRWFDAMTGGNLLGTGPTLLVTGVVINTTVYVEAFNINIDGCVSDRIPVMIPVVEDVVQTVANDTLICPGTLIELPWGEIVMPDANSSYSYTWPSTITGCDSLFLTVNVGIENIPPVTLPEIHSLFLGDSVLLIPQLDFQPDSILWSPADGLSCTGCLQPWARPVVDTEYLLTVWTNEGCITTAVVRIEVDRDIQIYFPNVFSPNGDNINDKFTVSGKQGLILVKSLVIYDRWGGAMWEGIDFPADGTFGWDGLSRGQKAATGVYVWMCEVELIDGSREVYSGDVTLLR